ncbi:MAG: ABC transporter permease [Anaerolineales bacterium]|nr:ABC transporter permease [Anaerolineales bacterium]MBS3753142.1 ABC transporter permease [Anaerolineales bacterium]
MNKLWLVAKNTYQQRIRSSTFLMLTFGIPLIMIVAGAIPVLTELRAEIPTVGYVDQTGKMGAVEEIEYEDEILTLKSYPDQNAGMTDLKTGKIGGLLILPKDYFQGGIPRYRAEKQPSEKLKGALEKAVRTGMLSGAPSWQVERLEDPANFTYAAQSTGKRVSEGPAVIIRVAIPVFFAMVFVLAIFTGANQMGSVMVKEKDQRAMEMVITSISPRELVAGKVMGMTLLSMTQVAVWTLGAGTAVFLLFREDLIGHTLSIPWNALLWAGLLCVPGYFLFALVGAGLGVIAGDVTQARQLAGMLGFIGMGPLYFMGVIVNAVDGPLAVGLTLFPFTAPTIGLFRMALTEVPTWQFLTSLLILVGSLLFSIWLVARVFRATMLLYGQKLKPAEIMQVISQSGLSAAAEGKEK